MIEFPTSGVETYWWLPIAVAFIISSLASVGGLSGAFLLMPFQISFLGFAGPSASATNLLFNIIAIPGGVYRHCREKRMVWPLAAAIIIGTIPGMLLGVLIRIKFLPEAGSFKIFVALVLLYLGIRLIFDIFRRNKNKTSVKSIDKRFEVASKGFNLSKISYDFEGNTVNVPTVPVFILSFIVGCIGGTYGIGGGAIIVPYLVAMYSVPVHTIAGAALFSTFTASVAGVGSYLAASLVFPETQFKINPDWMLGAMFGIGGFAGIYVGSRIQKYLPARLIKVILALCMLFIAAKYLFWR